MRYIVAITMLVGCGFHRSGGQVDAQADDVPALGFCPADPGLRLCFSFDQDPLPATLPDEGAAVVDAQLTGVVRIARDDGGAAMLDTASTIWVPMTTGVTNIHAVEVWYRAAIDPATDGARMGLVDSNVSPPNISLFLYRRDPMHELRCGLGSAVAGWTVAQPPGAWHYLACVCEEDNLRMYVDGVRVGETPGPCASGGGLVADGITIGQNNNGGAAGSNDWLVGAIDGVRLWDVALSAQTICQTAGLPSC